MLLVREIKEMLKIPKSTIGRHLQQLGLVNKLNIWIPHELKEIQIQSWSKRDELPQTTSKAELHQKKMM